MSLINLKPKKLVKTRDWLDPFESFHTEMDKLFEDFMGERSGIPATKKFTADFIPRLDLVEKDDKYKVTVELPGMEEKDIDVTLEDNVLTIKGEKKFEHEEDKKGWSRIERTYGSFYRQIPFKADLDDSAVEAKFKNGVLKLKLPKTKAAIKEAKKIEIKKD
jgi:HSP20 family protein